MLSEDLEKLNLYNILSGILDAPFFGFSPIEILWEAKNSALRIKDLKVLPNRWFGFDDKNRPRFRSLANPWEGDRLPFGKFVFAKHFPTYDNPYGLRLLSRCFWPVMFKKGSIKFWVKCLEKYGMPFLFGKHAKGAGLEEKQALLSGLIKMVQDGVGIGPEGSSVELLGGGAKSKSSGDAHERFTLAMDAEISKVVVADIIGSAAAALVLVLAIKEHRNAP